MYEFIIYDAVSDNEHRHIIPEKLSLAGVLAICLLGIIFLSTNVDAKNSVQVGDARFSTEYNGPVASLPIKGTGLLRYGGLIKVYAAALYCPTDIGQDELLDPSVPKRLELAYFVNLNRENFIEAAEVILEKQHGKSGLAALQPSLDKLHQMFVDVQSGDRYSITYLPGQGLMLERNGQYAGMVADTGLGTAYFGIWLGEPPISPGLKKDLIY